MYYWTTYAIMFALGAGMQLWAWTHNEMEECGHKAVFIMVVAVVLALTRLTTF